MYCTVLCLNGPQPSRCKFEIVGKSTFPCDFVSEAKEKLTALDVLWLSTPIIVLHPPLRAGLISKSYLSILGQDRFRTWQSSPLAQDSGFAFFRPCCEKQNRLPQNQCYVGNWKFLSTSHSVLEQSRVMFILSAS